ncbi:hypothetical protein AMATHDRAFT_85853 [Amanita thiersii Skay4041]|uniref:Uncharacterized protein n=1 Tax=Amanita thiersii Skay4041 TaxID=703135 RepID=A0A2A9NRN0_9AGAR|nr:hypothetical protein AMATHDRAFT_85853 [Amanita thiersii Skay4041]
MYQPSSSSSDPTTSTPSPTSRHHATYLSQLLTSLEIPADLSRYDSILVAAQPNTHPRPTPISPIKGKGKAVQPADSDDEDDDTFDTTFQDLKKKNLLPKDADFDKNAPEYVELKAQFKALRLSAREDEMAADMDIDSDAHRATLARLDAWVAGVGSELVKLRELLKNIRSRKENQTREERKGVAEDELSLETQADIVFTITAYIAAENDEGKHKRWISPSRTDLANDIANAFLTPQSSIDTSAYALPLPLLEVLLANRIKPIFQNNIHPSINPTTGRKLPRPAGGPLASQDFYEEQHWKEHPGIGNVMLWCVQHIQNDYYERIWHLLIPPLMTMLDDYEPKYKLDGVRIVEVMMKTVPGYLLKRTGVDGLIRSSLSTCLTHLESEFTPALIRETINAQIELTSLSEKIGEQAYFNQLCDVLGEGIIGGVWFYGADKQEAVLASMEALPRLIKALGIGTVRYLKALLAQILEPLIPRELRSVPVQMQIASLEALWCIMEECAPRIDRVKAGMITDVVARCWVTLVDQNKSETEVGAVKGMLKRTCEMLVGVCPGVIEDYKRIDGVSGGKLGKLFEGVSTAETAMPFSIDDLVASLSNNHIGQEALDIAALHAGLAPPSTATSTDTIPTPPGTQSSQKASHIQPCNTPTPSTPISASMPHLWTHHAPSIDDIESEDDERIVEDLLIPASTTHVHHHHHHPPSHASNLGHTQAQFSSPSDPSSCCPSSLFTSTDPFYIAQVEQMQARQNNCSQGVFSRMGRPQESSPFVVTPGGGVAQAPQQQVQVQMQTQYEYHTLDHPVYGFSDHSHPQAIYEQGHWTPTVSSVTMCSMQR